MARLIPSCGVTLGPAIKVCGKARGQLEIGWKRTKQRAHALLHARLLLVPHIQHEEKKAVQIDLPISREIPMGVKCMQKGS